MVILFAMFFTTVLIILHVSFVGQPGCIMQELQRIHNPAPYLKNRTHNDEIHSPFKLEKNHIIKIKINSSFFNVVLNGPDDIQHVDALPVGNTIGGDGISLGVGFNSITNDGIQHTGKRTDNGTDTEYNHTDPLLGVLDDGLGLGEEYLRINRKTKSSLRRRTSGRTLRKRRIMMDTKNRTITNDYSHSHTSANNNNTDSDIRSTDSEMKSVHDQKHKHTKIYNNHSSTINTNSNSNYSKDSDGNYNGSSSSNDNDYQDKVSYDYIFATAPALLYLPTDMYPHTTLRPLSPSTGPSPSPGPPGVGQRNMRSHSVSAPPTDQAPPSTPTPPSASSPTTTEEPVYITSLIVNDDSHCFGNIFSQAFVPFGGMDTVLINSLIYTFPHSQGILLSSKYDRYVWDTTASSQPALSILQLKYHSGEGILHWLCNIVIYIENKMIILCKSILAIVYLSAMSALILRVLLSSGVLVIFPLCFLMKYVGCQIPTRLIYQAYPWLGSELAAYSRNSLSTIPFYIGHFFKYVLSKL